MNDNNQLNTNSKVEKISIQDLIAPIAESTGLSKKIVEEFLHLLLIELEIAILKDGIVKVKGLGTFKLKWIEERKSVDVNTKQEIVIPAHNKVVFVPENELKDKVNAPYADLQAMDVKSVDPQTEEQEYLQRLRTQALEIKGMLNGLEPKRKSSKKKATKEPKKAVVEEQIPEPEVVEVKEVAEVAVSEVEKVVEPVESVESEVETKTEEIAEETAVAEIEQVQQEETKEEPLDAPLIVIEEAPSVVVEQKTKSNKRKKQKQSQDSDRPVPLENYDLGERVLPIKQRKSKISRVMDWVWIMLLLLIVVGGIGYVEYSTQVFSSFFKDQYIVAKAKYADWQKAKTIEKQDEQRVADSIALVKKEQQKRADSIALEEEQRKQWIASTIGTEKSTKQSSETLKKVEADKKQISSNATKSVAKTEKKTSIFEQPRSFSKYITTVILKKGNRLTLIAEKYYGHKDFWVYLYEANRDVITHPDDVKLNTKIKVPVLDDQLIDVKNPQCMEYVKSLQIKYLAR